MPLPIVAQILDNEHGQVFTEDPYFNEEYIFKNKIKVIYGQLMVKAEGDKMRFRNQKKQFHFNANGYLTKVLTIKGSDTSGIYYQYNEKGNLIRFTRSDRGGFASYYYSYNNDGQISKKGYYREQNRRSSYLHFEPINGHLVSSETFEYSEDTLAHRAFIKVYNTQGKPFKRITKEYDELGYLKEEREQYYIGNAYKKTIYSYNENGYLDSIVNESFTTSKKRLISVFEYDEQHNLSKKISIKEGQQYKIEEAVYDWENYTLKGIIDNNVKLKFMQIYRLTYGYYE